MLKNLLIIVGCSLPVKVIPYNDDLFDLPDGCKWWKDEKLFNNYINKDSIPDPDLIIRTGGEYRLSNFLIWQSAYSEFYTSEVLWPDFTKIDFYDALKSYSLRNRRFGTD